MSPAAAAAAAAPLTLTSSSLLSIFRSAACMELGIRKCKVGLLGIDGTQRLWLQTASGSFSPAMSYKDTVMGELFADFQASGGYLPTVLVIPDLRQVPRFANHPAVSERPHFVFTASAVMMTRNGAGFSHAVGIFTLWDSRAHPQFTPEQEAKLSEAADATRAALQLQLFSSLGMEFDDIAAGLLPPELPAVWVDFADLEWRVLGINRAWETLTGVSLDLLTGFPGLLAVLQSSDGTEAATIRYKVALAAADLPPKGSLPLIMSPRGLRTGLVQYVMSLRRASGPPPLPTSIAAIDTAVDPWVIECQAFLQGSDHRSLGFSIHSLPSFADESPGGSEQSWLKTTLPPKPFHRWAPELVSISIPAIPPRLASLHLGQILGSGSFASVFAGRLGDRPVAIKIIRHAYGAESPSDDWLAHYEAICNVDIAHNNIIGTLDWARLEDIGGWSVWIVEELADKGSLSAAITRGMLREGRVPGAPPDMRAILATAREIARGMCYLHSVGEIHGDLSSNNVMLVSADNARGFVAKISDFGLSRLEGTAAVTKTLGTISHMAPELLMQGKTSPSADVFSFGIILWEMFSGKRAWKGLSQYQIIYALTCHGERIKMPPEAPQEYAKLATECMSWNVRHRPTFEEVVPRIDAMVTALGPALSSPQSPTLRAKGHTVLSEA